MQLAACSVQPSPPNSSSSELHIYSTWTTLELDTFASAWLIKRFIDPAATFAFFPNGTTITEGIAFNTPDALYTRTHAQTTYANLISAHALSDPHLDTIAQIVHTVEIDYWLEITDPLTLEVDAATQAILAEASSAAVALEASFEYFDALYESLQTATRD